MSDKSSYEALVSKLLALDKKLLRVPDMPLEEAIKEGGIMAAAATMDVLKFEAIGADTTKITALQESVDALRYAQSVYIALIGEMKDAALQWSQELPGAMELRDDLLATCSYGLRDVPKAMRSIKRIRDGATEADLVQDLATLAELGNQYPDQLAAMKFDHKILATASQKASELGKIYSKAFIEKDNAANAHDMRDRAFTYMRMLMSDILRAAEFVFRKDRDRLEYYYSAYRSRKNSAYRAKTAAAKAAAEIVPSQTTVTVPA